LKWIQHDAKEGTKVGMEMEEITVGNIKKVLRTTKNRRGTGPGNIKMEVIKYGGNIGTISDKYVGIVLGYRLDHQGSRVRFPAGAGNFSVHHCVQNSSGAHPASYPMGNKVSFPRSKVTGS
jgi:hypothetical protein